MKLLPILAFVLCLGCANVTAPQSTTAFYTDKTAFEEAKHKDTLAVYEEFLASRPNSPWKTSAIYHRDRLALEEAKRRGTPDAFRAFLAAYPNSDWADQARYYLKYGVPSAQEANKPAKPTS